MKARNPEYALDNAFFLLVKKIAAFGTLTQNQAKAHLI